MTQKQLACKIVDLTTNPAQMLDPSEANEEIEKKKMTLFKEVELLKKVSHV
jgi:hypothetical protein